MPTRNRNFLKVLFRRNGDAWEYEMAEEDTAARNAHAGRPRTPARRLALVAAFTSLFFAGAVFTAGAGDQLARFLEADDAAALKEFEAAPAVVEAVPAAPEAVPAAPEVVPAAPEVVAVAPEVVAVAPEVVPAAPEAVAAAPDVSSTPVSELAEEKAAVAAEAVARAQATAATEAASPADPSAVAPNAPSTETSLATPTAAAAKAPTQKRVPAKAKAPATTKWVVKRAAAAPAPAPEIEHEHGSGEPTIWLNRALPDPTPPSARLTREFAHQLVSIARQHDADWAAVLGVLRAQGERGSAPASAAELNTIAARISTQEAWRGALALSGRTAFADSAEALADLYRAVGIEALVIGFEAAKERIGKRLLAAENVWIYDGGREDIAAGRIDVRILAVIQYVHERHGSVTVSSLFSGHRKFSRPGVVSAHTYGHAVDIAAVGELSILGNQQPGGITEAAVRSLLLLPAELQPQQVISLLGLGGPSFPMRDHGDHIHVGF